MIFGGHTVSEEYCRADEHPRTGATSQLAGRAYEIGKLQETRKFIHGLRRRPGQDVFSAQTIHDEWAFHHGGRGELQFNIGLERDGREVRHGVAFSFQTSQTLPSVDPLARKAAKLGEYLRSNERAFADMRMWHYRDGVRSSDYAPGPVLQDLVEDGTFVFLGKCQSIDNIDARKILRDFDRLLPLYCFVESDGRSAATKAGAPRGFTFRAGCQARAADATASYAKRELDISLRHNLLQDALCQELIAEFGEKNVGDEQRCGDGKAIDVVVRVGPDSYQLFEIKTQSSPRACIREAMGQLLEYAYYWQPAIVPALLVICGESELNADDRNYLQLMTERHKLPLAYRQILLLR